MKTTKRKRKERRLRILERNAIRSRARETAVAAEVRRERRMAHRENLVRKYEAIREQLGLNLDKPTDKVSFLRRLLGMN